MTVKPPSNPYMDRITEQDAFKAEQKFLARMFADNSVLKDCGLVAADFGEDLHQTIFANALELYRREQKVTPIALKPCLPKVLDGFEVAPVQYLVNLQTAGADPKLEPDVEGAIQIIKAVAFGRHLAREGSTAVELAKEGYGLVTLVDEVENLETRLKEVRTRLSALQSTVSPGTIYMQSFDHAAKRNGMVGVPIPFEELRRVLSEPVFEAGNLYGLLSASGEGKTSFTLQLIWHALRSGHPVLFLSYDQNAAQCVRQIISQEYGISVEQQRDPTRMMNDRERDKCVRFATDINRLPFEIIRCKREGVQQLVAYAQRFIKNQGNGLPTLIVLDHIGKVKPRDPKLSADRISGEVTVELKALAEDLNASVLVLNQRNSEGEKRNNPRPIARDLYGGSGARNDYDAIITLYRPEKYRKEAEKVATTGRDWEMINKVFGGDIEGIAEIAAIKVRFGDPSIIEKLKFEAEYTRYVSMKPQREQELDF